MGLTLRNCTTSKLAYKIIIAGSKWHYVDPGKDGQDIKHWGTFTLRVEVDSRPETSSIRPAVNPDGTYYGVLGDDGKIKILSQDDARRLAMSGSYGTNKNITTWFPDAPQEKEIKFPVKWELKFSKANTSPGLLSFSQTIEVGISNAKRETHQLIIEKSSTTGFSLGAGFTIHEVDVSASVSHEETNTTTNLEETVYETEIYSSESETLEFKLEEGKSLALWQPYIDIFGHRLWLKHHEFTTAGYGEPTNTTFEPAKVRLFYDPRSGT